MNFLKCFFHNKIESVKLLYIFDILKFFPEISGKLDANDWILLETICKCQQIWIGEEIQILKF